MPPPPPLIHPPSLSILVYLVTYAPPAEQAHWLLAAVITHMCCHALWGVKQSSSFSSLHGGCRLPEVEGSHAEGVHSHQEDHCSVQGQVLPDLRHGLVCRHAVPTHTCTSSQPK